MTAQDVRDTARILAPAGAGDTAIGTLTLGEHSNPAAWTVSVCRT